MSGCILTQDVAYCDAIDIGEMECPICLTISKAKAGWYGVLLTGCKHEWHEEMWMGSIVMDRRKYLNLTRKQMGEVTGYSPKTIKSYEWSKCSKAYFDKTREVIKREGSNVD